MRTKAFSLGLCASCSSRAARARADLPRCRCLQSSSEIPSPVRPPGGQNKTRPGRRMRQKKVTCLVGLVHASNAKSPIHFCIVESVCLRGTLCARYPHQAYTWDSVGQSEIMVRSGCYYSSLSSHHADALHSDLPRLATFLCASGCRSRTHANIPVANGLSVLAVRFGCYYSSLSSHRTDALHSDRPRLATVLCASGCRFRTHANIQNTGKYSRR